MKPTVLAIFSLYLSIHGQAQARAQATAEGQQLIQKKCRSEHARLWLDKYGRNYPEIFDEIRVLDARPDTSRIGIVPTGTSGQSEILLEGPVTSQMTGYLNTIYARPKGGHSLLIVLKNLWIASAYNFHFHVEAYLQAKSGFMPLTSIDTALDNLKGETAGVVAEKEIRALFAEFMDRIAEANLEKERRIVSAEQIDSFNRIRFAYPMDTATQLVKGAYRSVEEFLNNEPSIGNAELSADKTGSVELDIPDENGQLYYTRSVWGYCDGSHTYLMIDGNLFPIFIICHQFYVLGSKEYRSKSKVLLPLDLVLFGAVPALLISMGTHIEPSVVRDLRVYRIDTGTGHVIE